MFRRRRIGTFWCASALLLGLAIPQTALALNPPAGWQQRNEPGMSTFVPKTAPGQLFSLMLSDPMPMQGLSLRQWAPQAVNSVASSYGKIISRGKPAFKPPLWTVKHEVAVNGKRFTAIYHAFVQGPDQARLSIMLGDPEQFAHHAPAAADIIAAALRESGTTPSPTNARTGSGGTGQRNAASGQTVARTEANDTAAGSGTRTAKAGSGGASGDGSSARPGQQGKNRFAFSANDIQTVLNHAETTYGVYGLEVEETTHVLLKGGRLYTNGKANGTWRKRGNGYQYQPTQGSQGWKTLKGDPTLGINARTLPGYYNADRGASFGTTIAVTRNRIEFHPNGRYETDHHFSGYTQMGDQITTPQTTTAVSKGKGIRQGSYRVLNPYAIELKGDDGSVRQVIAYFTDDERKWLNLNETAYQRK
ncbi:MAG: hypothetical protein Q4B17_05970 [Lautropia sp.]|nr:hypothetical protein [Lautropia sp.]